MFWFIGAWAFGSLEKVRTCGARRCLARPKAGRFEKVTKVGEGLVAIGERWRKRT
jgi:hypothetical protein